ncbi:MAG: DUF47 family protein [Candidatus Lokiarchaeota archaeon]|nr:DUF47 family protein [Candidatus Lokiarchaeota archaeon]
METRGITNRIMQVALDHARKVKEAGQALAQCVESWVKGDLDDAKLKYQQIVDIEAEADKFKNALTTELAEIKALGLLEKEMDPSLILRSDNLTDWAEGTGQRLMNCSWRKLPKIVADKAIELADITMQTLALHRDAFFALNDNPDKVLKICNDISQAERKSDISFREMQKVLYSDELKDVDLRKILPFLDAMEHLEDMGDIAEQVADSLKLLYIAKYGMK